MIAIPRKTGNAQQNRTFSPYEKLYQTEKGLLSPCELPPAIEQAASNESMRIH